MIRTDLIRPVPERLAEHAANRPERIAFSDECRQVSSVLRSERYTVLPGVQGADHQRPRPAAVTVQGALQLIEIDEIPRTGSGTILRLRPRERLAE